MYFKNLFLISLLSLHYSCYGSGTHHDNTDPGQDPGPIVPGPIVPGPIVPGPIVPGPTDPSDTKITISMRELSQLNDNFDEETNRNNCRTITETIAAPGHDISIISEESKSLMNAYVKHPSTLAWPKDKVFSQKSISYYLKIDKAQELTMSKDATGSEDLEKTLCVVPTSIKVSHTKYVLNAPAPLLNWMDEDAVSNAESIASGLCLSCDYLGIGHGKYAKSGIFWQISNLNSVEPATPQGDFKLDRIALYWELQPLGLEKDELANLIAAHQLPTFMKVNEDLLMATVKSKEVPAIRVQMADIQKDLAQVGWISSDVNFTSKLIEKSSFDKAATATQLIEDAHLRDLGTLRPMEKDLSWLPCQLQFSEECRTLYFKSLAPGLVSFFKDNKDLHGHIIWNLSEDKHITTYFQVSGKGSQPKIITNEIAL